jgi:hypothetical protein
MTMPDPASRAALDRLDRADRQVLIVILAAAVVEAVLLVLILLTIDFGDQLQRLVFLLALLTYFTLGLGLVALGAHVSRVRVQLLNALELLRDSPVR